MSRLQPSGFPCLSSSDSASLNVHVAHHCIPIDPALEAHAQRLALRLGIDLKAYLVALQS